MEKYGVCNTCHGRPTGPEDLVENFEKLANGNYRCPTCKQNIFGTLDLNDTVVVTETSGKENEESSDS